MLRNLVCLAAALPCCLALAQPPGYTTVWKDDFNSSALDLTKWSYRTDAKMESSQRPQNVAVEGGNLAIHLRKEDDRGKQYTAGGVISKERFRYGYYEARVKMFGAAGWHQSVWGMYAGDGDTTYPNLMRTEIDGMEFDSDTPWKAHMGLIKWDGPGKSRNLTCTPGVYRGALGFDASTGFHNFGFEWTEKQVRYYLDGDLRCALDYPPGDHQHDRINFWLTAIAYRKLSGGHIDDGALPGEMLIDWAAYSVKDLYLDDSDPAYREQGAWKASAAPGYSRSGAREACSDGAVAEWRATAPAAGEYRLFVYRNPAQGRARVEAPGISRPLDFTQAAAEWVDLGARRFATGEDATVKFVRESGCVAADMIKWVRQ